MSIKSFRSITIIIILCLVYGLIFYLQFTKQLKLDFSAFYSTSAALREGINPYVCFDAPYLGLYKKLPANLNPPIFLCVLQPFSLLEYRWAVPLWSLLSFISGLVGAAILARLVFNDRFLHKNWLFLLFIYLGLFSTIMNTAIAQMGALIFFFTMVGYYAYLHRQDLWAGVMWGTITAFKIFPGLLFFLALKQQRYRVCLTHALTTAVLWIIPILYFGTTIYKQYFQMLQKIFWYGDNWNASLFGFIFRLFIDPHNKNQNLLLIKLAFLVVFLLILWRYLKQIKVQPDSQSPHYPMCLTMIMMLLLSPFGWLYYFSLTLLPLVLTWQQIAWNPLVETKYLFLWCLCFLILNLPVDYVLSLKMTNLWSQMTIYSIYFYGLLLLTYLTVKLLGKSSTTIPTDGTQSHQLIVPILISISFGMLPIAYYFKSFVTGGNLH